MTERVTEAKLRMAIRYGALSIDDLIGEVRRLRRLLTEFVRTGDPGFLKAEATAILEEQKE